MPLNGLEQRYRTLGECLTELKARLSFVAQGPSSNNNNPVLISFLREGHDFLYRELDPTPSKKRTEIATNTGSTLYDWNNDIEDEPIDPSRVTAVWVELDGTTRVRLHQGINEAMRGENQRAFPTRYDTLNGQMEIHPIPDRSYQIVVEYIAPKPRFNVDSDRPGVPDRLLVLYAIAQGKAHYRHPDAQAAGAIFEKMLRTEKAAQHENRRYSMEHMTDAQETVLRGDNGTFTFTVR